MSFRVQVLEARQFSHLYGLQEDQLARFGAQRFVVDLKPGFPDRTEMRSLDIGQIAILLS